MTYRELLHQTRKNYLLAVLAEHGGDVLAAAKYAGLNSRHYYKLLNQHCRPEWQPRVCGNEQWHRLEDRP